MLVFVARDQSVLCVDLVIDARAEIKAPIWQRHCVAETNYVESRIQNRGVDDRIVIDVALFKIKKERSLLFGNRPAYVAAKLTRHVGWACGRERIARIQCLVVEAE